MHSTDSDLLPFEVTRPLPRRLRHAFHAIVVIGGLVGGGVSIGYFLGVQQQRQDSLAEIARLQEAYGPRIERAVGAVADAAVAATNAAEAMGEAAANASKSAATVSAAAPAAANPATAFIPAPPRNSAMPAKGVPKP